MYSRVSLSGIPGTLFTTSLYDECGYLQVLYFLRGQYGGMAVVTSSDRRRPQIHPRADFDSAFHCASILSTLGAQTDSSSRMSLYSRQFALPSVKLRCRVRTSSAI